MSKYSILFGASKHHIIGPFRFPVYEDLTPGETKEMERINKKQAKSTYKSMKLAQRISKDKDIPIKDAVEILGNLSDDKNEDVLYSYADEIEALSEETMSATEQKIVLVTLFMRFRGQAMLPESDKWINTADWTDEDTEVMPSKTLDSIFQLMLWERDGWPTEGNETPMTKQTSK